MDNLNDIKKIWLGADTADLPAPREVIRAIKKYRRLKLLKKAAVIIVALVLTGVMVSAVFNYKSTLLTTRIGEACIIIAGIFLITANIASLSRIYYFKDQSNKEFIAFLEQTHVRQVYYYKKTQVIALAIVSVGLFLYLFEGVYKDPLLCIVAYALLIAYILIMWLVVRPRAFRRQTKKLNETIKKLEELSKQF